VRQENPLGHSNFLIGLKSSGERNGGLGLARYKSVLSRLSVGRPYAICHMQLPFMAGGKFMALELR
jgi:hypothetical protein